MKVILLKELQGKGGEGDVIDVNRGFANNFLLTQGYAILATKGNLKQLEQRRGNIAKREEKRIEDANALKASLEGKKILVEAKVGEEGVLFGSVTAKEIAEELKKQYGVDVDKRKIELDGDIKAFGTYRCEVKLYTGISAKVYVVVTEA